MRRTLIAVLSVLAFVGGPTSSNAQSASDLPALVERLQPAVVQLRTFDAAGAPLGTGSGFFGPDGRIVTNAHVVRGAARAEAFDAAGRLLGTTQHAEVLSTSVDLAVLPRIGQPNSVIQLASIAPRVGEPVIVIGSPLGFSNTVTNGLVSAVREYEGRRLVQISAPISPGSSGGPVLNAQGELIGVSVAVIEGGQNLNFAVPVSDVQALLGSPAGRYSFGAAAPAAPSRVAATPIRAGGSEMVTTLVLGQTYRGTLTPGDRVTDNGHLMDAFVYDGRQGDRIRIAAVSDEVDPVLSLGLGGEVIALDDDGGGGTSALVERTLPRTGEYIVLVMAHEANTSGGYTVSIQRATGTVRSESAPSSTSSDRWVPSAATSRYEQEYDRTSLRVISPGTIQVFTRSTYVEPYTDDAGDTYDSQITQYQIDCRRRRMRSTSVVQYLGSSMVYSSSQAGSWGPIIPESVGEELARVTCRAAGIR